MIVKTYIALIKQNILVFFQYRIVVYVWMVGKILEPMIFMVVWIAATNAGNGQISGVSRLDFIKYYILLMIVSHFTFTYLIWNFGDQVRTGIFSNKLLLPFHTLHHYVAENISYKLITMPVVLIFAYILKEIYHINYDVNITNILIFILTLLISFLLRLFFEFTISLSAFWIIDVRGINQFYYLMLLFFSGRAVPLFIFPKILQSISKYLPFRYMVSFPIEILLNNLTTNDIYIGLLIQFGWFIIIIIILRYIYGLGLKKFSAEGI